MPTKPKNNKTAKSRVSSKAKKSTDKKLFIALGVLLVAIVAVAGIVYYRQSQASSTRGPIYTVKTIGGAYGLIQLMKYNQGREAGTIIVKPTSFGWYQIVPQTTSNVMCLKPLGSVKNSGPITKLGAYNSVEERPCV